MAPKLFSSKKRPHLRHEDRITMANDPVLTRPFLFLPPLKLPGPQEPQLPPSDASTMEWLAAVKSARASLLFVRTAWEKWE